MAVEHIGWVTGVLALLFAGYLSFKLRKIQLANKKVKDISVIIREGAMSFLNAEYKILTVFVIIVAIALYFILGAATSGVFIFGAILSALAGNIGMRTATSANAKTAENCKKSLNLGLTTAFASGSVMGMSVVGLGLLGVTVAFMIVGDPAVLFGFGFGASSIALFARVGGGIYTKAADVGADLVGKVEKGIPEDDPRNPATIADNVGDNVGDVAGMGADLFESYVDSIIAAIAIGFVAYATANATILPLAIAGVGIISSIIGFFFVRTGEGKNPHSALNKGIFGSAIVMAILSFFLIQYLMADLSFYFAMLSGLVAGIVIGLVTEYYTSTERGPTRGIAKAAETGPATTIISGLSVGMKSTAIPVLAVAATIMFSYHFAGLYGIAIAAVGMLSTLGITLATDTYGPVADNAAGIAEMAGLGPETRKRAEELDAVGNTTAAIGKGFAIGSAALTALALFSVYSQTANISVISIIDPLVIVGLFLGGLMPFVFSALTMNSVGKAAYEMVNEVRRQFREIKGIMSGKAKPDYKRCVEISTKSSLREMVAPGVLAIIAPILVGYFLGAAALGGLLAGSTVVGFLLALMMANSGGAWDNAKKYIETGQLGGKGSPAHKAAVVGDTVGDPFKDTSGPSINILIKLTAIVALIVAAAIFV